MPRTPSAIRQAARVLLLPYWTAQLATGAKSFIDNPVLGHPRLNALGLHNLRQDVAHRLAARRRARLGRTVDAAHRTAFERDGFVVIENFLPQDAFARVEREVRAFRGPARETVQGDTVTRRLALDGAARRRMPGVAALLRDPDWRALLRYVGSHDQEPVSYIQTILTGVNEGPPDPQTALHADTFQPTVKAWLTLTDVAADGAPFVYVPGSHRLTPARRAWERRMSIEAAQGGREGGRPGGNRLTGRGSFRIEEAALAGLGYAPPRRFSVGRNTLIVADTSGFHARGPSAAPTTRVEIWAYGRRNPFVSLPIDPWRIEALGAARAPIFWRAGDVLARLGVKRQTWRAREGVSAFDPA